jgi:hypothetical protein
VEARNRGPGLRTPETLTRTTVTRNSTVIKGDVCNE